MTDRRSDLDALRGVAMLLGIVLHASISFFGLPWSIHEQKTNAILAIVGVWIHGFRMPLFFILSGFFTQLVFEQRGLKKLVRQRFERIFIPLVLATLCIVPLNEFVIRRASDSVYREPVIEAIVRGDSEFLKTWIRSGGDPNYQDGIFFRHLVGWASLCDNVEALTILSEHQANLDGQDPSGNTSLHVAVFFGCADSFEFLMDHGANPSITNNSGRDAFEGLTGSEFIASNVYQLIGALKTLSPEEIQAGRKRISSYLAKHPAPFQQHLSFDHKSFVESIVAKYWAARSSDRLIIPIGSISVHLVDTQIFDHLWFLSFLLWILLIYVVFITMGWKPATHHSVLAAICTLVGQFFMGTFGASFGPDTEFGLLPAPHLLMYYTGFFFFGAIMRCSEPIQSWIRRNWWWVILVSLFILFPVALTTRFHRLIAMVLQPLFACGMSLGMIGLFQHYVKTPSKKIRWVADSSYWLYLAHIPIVIAAQIVVVHWNAPSWIKFIFVLAVTILILLVSYQWLIRYSWVGRLLHGPKQVPDQQPNQLEAKPS